MTELLGGKGANLAEMARLGLNVPPGFTITTKACAAFVAAGKKFPPGLEQEVRDGLDAQSSRRSASNSATSKRRFLFPCAQVRGPRCRA